MNRNGEFNKTDRSARNAFSESNWGLNSIHGKWIKRLRKSIENLDEEDWGSIIKGAEESRVTTYSRRKRPITTASDDNGEDGDLDDEERYPTIQINKRRRI